MKTPVKLMCLLFAVASHGMAQMLLVSSPGTGFTTGYPGPYNLGYEFKVGSSPVTVSGLGFYDFGNPGLSDAHQVGLWTDSGDLLASVTIPEGTHALVQGFAFEPIGLPVQLSPNTNYVVSAYWPSSADTVYADFFGGAVPEFFGASLVGSRNTIMGTSSTFEFPSNSGGDNGFAWIGANIQFSSVPEPSTLVTALSGVFGLIVFAKRRKG